MDDAMGAWEIGDNAWRRLSVHSSKSAPQGQMTWEMEFVIIEAMNFATHRLRVRPYWHQAARPAWVKADSLYR